LSRRAAEEALSRKKKKAVLDGYKIVSEIGGNGKERDSFRIGEVDLMFGLLLAFRTYRRPGGFFMVDLVYGRQREESDVDGTEKFGNDSAFISLRISRRGSQEAPIMIPKEERGEVFQKTV